MKYLLTLAVYILAFGALGAALGLSYTLWGRYREKKLLKTFLFIAYLTLLFLLGGLRFALTGFAGWDRGTLVFDILERVVLSSLIFFLPATMNFILDRRWTTPRIVRVIVSVVIFLSSGIVSLFINSSPIPGILAVLAFLFIIFFVLVVAARELPLIRDEITRMALTLLYSVTFLYLPLIQVLHLVSTGYELAMFIASSIYHIILAMCAIVYFHRSLVSPDFDSIEDSDSLFHTACDRAGLTKREVEIAQLISTGFTYKEIALQLDISPNTVSNHVGTIYRKTGTRSKIDMVNVLWNYSI